MTDARNEPIGVLRRKAFYRAAASGFLSLLAVLVYALIVQAVSPDSLEWGVVGAVLVLSMPVVIGMVLEAPLFFLRPRQYAVLRGFGIVLRALVVVASIVVYGEVWPKWFGAMAWLPDPIDNLVVLGMVAVVASVVCTTLLGGLGRAPAPQ